MARFLNSAALRASVRDGMFEDLAWGPGRAASGLAFPADLARLDLGLGLRAASAPPPTPLGELALGGLAETAAFAERLRESLDLTAAAGAAEGPALRCGCAYCMKGVDGFPIDGVGERLGPVTPQPLLVTIDAQPGDTSTTAELIVDGPHIISTLDTVGDQDFFRVELEAGQYYDIGMYLTLLGPSGVPLADAYIELYDSAGNLIVSADGGGPNTPSGLDAKLTYQAEYTGTYYVNARAYDQDSINGTTGDFVGDYELFVDAVQPTAATYIPFYSPDSPLHSIDWGSQVDRTVRNPDGDNGPRDNGVPNTGVIRHAQYDIEGKNVITYYFAKQGDVFVDEDPTNPGLATMVAQGMQQWEKDAFRKAFDLYEQVADLLYIEVDNRWEADFKIITYEGTPGIGASLLGRMSPPNEPNEGQTEVNSGDLRWTEEGVSQGGFYFPTLLHELGHGHGLAHPHDNGGRSGIMRGSEAGLIGGSLADFDLSQQVFTIMSYNDGWQSSPFGQPRSGGITGMEVDHWGWMGTLAALDIAVLQDKYGVNEEWATGDDVYLIKDENGPGTFYATIWDAAGTDEIRYEGARNATIDLRAATLNYEEGGGGRVSYAFGVHAGFTIANGVTIENAATGSGDDVLIGNDAANLLRGGAGADTLSGAAGDDVIEGGAGADILKGGGGRDTLSYEGSAGRVVVRLSDGSASGGHAKGDVFSGFENLTGGAFNDTLFGADGANVLKGGAGDDYLNGLAGNDVLIGGAGADRMHGSDGIDTVSYEGSNAGVTVRLKFQTASGGHAEGDLLTGFENAMGSSHNDRLMGSDEKNRLTGGDGDDYLDGLGGHDFLVGGAGADRMRGGEGRDVFDLVGGSGADIILDFEAGVGAGDRIRLDSALFADFGDVLAHTNDDGLGNTVISKGAVLVTLSGVVAAQLAADDFVFVGVTAEAAIASTAMPAWDGGKPDDAWSDGWTDGEPRIADDKEAPLWAPVRQADEPILPDLGLTDLALPAGRAHFSRHEPETPWDWIF